MAAATAAAEDTGPAELEELETELLLAAVARRHGYDFRHYAAASLRRRLRRAMQEEGVPTLSALQDRLLHDPGAIRRFVSTLSVHVTGMFRDPDVYLLLRKKVVPLLRTWPFVRVWHAGCSTGEEVYSLAIVLHEEGLLPRCRIYATDLSDELLDVARRGVYPLRALRGYTAAYHQSGGRADFSSYYTADSANAIVREDLRRHIVFSPHNLVSDGSFNEFHLILCRNVMIYFDKGLRDRVIGLLHDSLAMFGVLALGLRETLRFAPCEGCFEVIDEPRRLYRRVR
ncbi:MAG TPA: protein-glutamate O-methyltransferase CheR [Thermoanaerobaculia bacterium]|nr:protein-glutamate O-methyltransferase CheR [Thermoanaerobaculia bacterium]